jgi:hypothetical protein
MDEDKREPFDLYCDAFTITITPFGANLSFARRDAHPSPNQAPQMKQLGTMRMSVEHLKTLIWISRQQVRQVEGQMGVKAEVSRNILNQFGVPPDEWDEFWKPISGL